VAIEKSVCCPQSCYQRLRFQGQR